MNEIQKPESFDLDENTDLYKKAIQVATDAYKVVSEPLSAKRDSLAVDKLREQAAETQQSMAKMLAWKNTLAETAQAYQSQAKVYYGKLCGDKVISTAERDGYIGLSAKAATRLARQLDDMYALAGKRMSLAQTLIKSNDYTDFNTVSLKGE